MGGDHPVCLVGKREVKQVVGPMGKGEGLEA